MAPGKMQLEQWKPFLSSMILQSPNLLRLNRLQAQKALDKKAYSEQIVLLADGYTHISSNNSDPSSDEYYLVKSKEEEEERDQILPQFGEWKVDSSLADGYTHMTKPEEMQCGEDYLPVATNACQSEDRHCRLHDDNLKGCGCFPWGRK